MNESKTRVPHDVLTDAAHQSSAERRVSASDSALARVLRQVRLDATAGSGRPAASAFNSAL